MKDVRWVLKRGRTGYSKVVRRRHDALSEDLAPGFQASEQSLEPFRLLDDETGQRALDSADLSEASNGNYDTGSLSKAQDGDGDEFVAHLSAPLGEINGPFGNGLTLAGTGIAVKTETDSGASFVNNKGNSLLVSRASTKQMRPVSHMD